MILGGEELLVERAIAEILRAARASAGTDDVPVDHLRAGDVSTNELAELLSPSLFADERVVERWLLFGSPSPRDTGQ